MGEGKGKEGKKRERGGIEETRRGKERVRLVKGKGTKRTNREMREWEERRKKRKRK